MIDNLIGHIFGRWTIISGPIFKKYRRYYTCQCSCKNKTIKNVRYDQLIAGESKSCGCLALEMKTKHGMSRNRIARIWYGIIDRCTNMSREDYIRYGGRGIKVCDEWLPENNGQANFINWSMSNGYKEKLTIERIDVNGNYEPENCTWITLEKQANNKRNTIFIKIDDEETKLMDLTQESGIKRETILRRSRSGIENKELLLSPKRINNVSGVTGVSFCKRHNSWRAYININKKRIELGYKKEMSDAIILRLLKEKELFGDNSPQKHLFKEYGIV